MIYTSVAVIDGSGGPGLRKVETVDVEMRNFSAREIDRYLAEGESMDKAGAYSIQGAGRALIAAMRGDYLAAVGLPLLPIAQYLTSRGMTPNANIHAIYADKPFQNWRSFD